MNSKIDKVQKFLSKLKNIKDEGDAKKTIEEMNTLNLSRYTGEIIEIIAESKLQQKEVILFIDLTIAMHRRYKDFASQLVVTLHKQFQVCEGCGDETAKAFKRRQILKLLSELYLKGLISDISKVGKCIKEIVLIYIYKCNRLL